MVKGVTMKRLIATILLVLSVATSSATRAEIVLHDIAGHDVTLNQPARRLLIDDSRILIALALIAPDPVGLLCAWPRDINRLGKTTFAAFETKFPAIDRLASSSSSASPFSVEKVLAAAPDLAVFSAAAQPSDADRKTIEAAGIPILIVDFFTHPIKDLEPSLRLLGEAIGEGKRTEAFLSFRSERLAAITRKIADNPSQRPLIFMEPHAGASDDCCNSPGRGNVGDIINVVGGNNIGHDPLKHAFGKISAEYIIQQDPEVYIATGGDHLEGTGGLIVGPTYSAEQMQESLERVVHRPLFENMRALRNKRVFGLSHHLLNSPLDIVTIELLAAWIHPQLFNEQEVEATLAFINTNFLAVPLKGPLWIDLKPRS